MSQFFLGLDSSTQSLTGVVIDLATRKIVHEASVNFDEALPKYGTRHGVLRDADPRVVHAPPMLWVEALDLVLQRLKASGAPLGQIGAVAGSGQQHGSVYLNRFAPSALAGLDARKALHENLDHIFSRATSPIWMDSSTTLECDEITRAVGGREALIANTGSAAFERFTGPQVRKFAKQESAAYADTAHIALVSSFMASILAGRIAPIDPGDGAGMNLMQIGTCADWHQPALDATADDLRRRLPALAPSWTTMGPIHAYFVHKFGFAANTQCVVWSGDNPCSVIGLGLVEAGQTAISLGTSDTYFGTMSACRTDPQGEGHVFGSPTGGYMTLLCFKNGSLAREQVRDHYHYSWAEFSAALRATPPGNQGAIMLPWFDPEITPRVLKPGVVRVQLREDNAAANCRAVVEAQMLSMRLHSTWMGERPTRILATGGASSNQDILQIMADVHGCPVYRIDTTASAALGAALRAAHAWHHARDPMPWQDVVRGFTDPIPGSHLNPNPAAVAVYNQMIETYAQVEARALGR